MRILFFATILVLGSCTITKRVHRPGFHVQWNTSYSTYNGVEKSENQTDPIQVIQEDYVEEIGIRTEMNEPKKNLELGTTALKIPESLEEIVRPNLHSGTVKNLSNACSTFMEIKKKHAPRKLVVKQISEKGRNFYSNLAILSILLIFTLVIIVLVTLASPSLYYTAGIALLGIPLLFIYAIRNIKIAKSFPVVSKARVVPKKQPNQSNNNQNNTDKVVLNRNETKNTAAIVSLILFLSSILLIFVPFLSILLFLGSSVAGVIGIVRNKQSPVPLRYTNLAWVSVGITLTILVLALIIIIALILF